MKFISKLKIKTIEGMVFKNEGYLNSALPPFDYTLRIIRINNKSTVNKIDQKKNDSNICYAVFDKNKLIHESWVFKTKLLTKQLGFNRVKTVGDCYTIDSYQGRGIYTFVLQKILLDYSDKQIVIYTDLKNVASIKGILKAGFKKLYRFRLVRFFGISFRVQKYED